jgi:hypothetical protein
MKSDGERGATFTRRTWLSAIFVAAGPAALGGYQSGGWSLRFLKVKGILEVRLDGPNGQLIVWEDRGLKGKHTWASADRQPETRSIENWVKERRKFSLHAKISRESENDPTDPFCQMETLFKGQSKGTWQFQDQARRDYAGEPGEAPPPGRAGQGPGQ